jgi:hypothetical protein
MKELIKILESAAAKHGHLTPLTIGHLLNICKMAENLKQKTKDKQAILEEKRHNQILADLSWGIHPHL